MFESLVCYRTSSLYAMSVSTQKYGLVVVDTYVYMVMVIINLL